MTAPTLQPDPPTARAPLKFAFATGSRPLAGYTIKRGIGRGGFGEVYFAVSDGGKEVALKLIRRNLDVELRGVMQCLNLKHPHLLSLHDVRDDDEQNCWVVMEYVAGESLEGVLERSPRGLPTPDALAWMRGIAAGVSYLHNHGIVHRDLKPGNIFNDEGVIKLGDYGLSKFISCSRRSGQTESVGTVHYMAPEIANGRYGREIDIYALGIILYEMLTGRVPFEGESVGEVLMKHLTAEPDLKLVDEPYRTVIGRTLAKDPAKRFITVDELLASLPASNEPPVYQSMQSGGGVIALTQRDVVNSPPANEEPIWKWLRTSYGQIADLWKNSNLNLPTKLLIVGAGLFATASMWPLLPLLFAVMYLYFVYRVVRAVYLYGSKAKRPREIPAERPVVEARTKRQLQPTLYQAPPKSMREQVADWLGSLLVSSIAVAVISLVMVLLRGQPPRPEQYAWVAIVSVLGSWSVLTAAKLWESSPAEPARRRFVMLVIGLALGGVAYLVHSRLWVELPFDIRVESVDKKLVPKSFYGATDGAPLLYAYLAYFGFLFLLVRWWRGADPGRTSRVSLWPTLAALFVAWLLNFVWPFPQPWGCMVSATISIAVQLASPWHPAKPPAFRTANNL